MSTITRAVTELKRERDQVELQLQRIDETLHALNGLRRGPGRPSNGRRKIRHMNVATRRRMAVAQRARWANLKAKRA